MSTTYTRPFCTTGYDHSAPVHCGAFDPGLVLSVGSDPAVAAGGKNSRASRSAGVNDGFGTNAPSSCRCAGSERSTARRPPAYQVSSATCGKTVGLWEEKVPFLAPHRFGSFSGRLKVPVSDAPPSLVLFPVRRMPNGHPCPALA